MVGKHNNNTRASVIVDMDVDVDPGGRGIKKKQNTFGYKNR